MQHFKKIILGLLLIFSFSFAKAQVTASFYVVGDTTSCNFLVVNFVSTSTGSGLQYHWIFGNGNTNTGNPTPSASYLTPGDYTVALIVNNGVDYDTLIMTDLITIFERPNSDFSIDPLVACINSSVDFESLSTEGDASISTWSWIFGDGNTATGSNVSHTYNVSGIWHITHEVIDDNGCLDTLTQTVEVVELPVVDINADITNYCAVPIDITFNNIPSCTGCTYEWDFGDGGTSSDETPVHEYTDLGSFDIILIVTDPYGCVSTDTFPDFIQISSITASFDIPDGDTICVNVLTEFNNTSGIYCSWDFGDGNTISHSDSLYDYHSYSSSGFYDITLIAAPGDLCADTIVQTIYVEEAIADFFADPQTACQVPAIIAYDASASSSNVVSWEWHFGDGNIETFSNSSTTNTYNSEGSYNDTLIVTTANGCIDILIIPNDVVIEFPVAGFVGIPNEGCAPLPVVFTNLSVSNEPIVNWEWTFPNGSPATFNGGSPPTITFDPDGEFEVMLVIINNEGCTDTAYYTIEVGIPITPDFDIIDTAKCASDIISFINLTVDSALVDSWDWTFSTEFEPEDMYLYHDDVCSDTGYCQIQLITEYNGCYDTLTVDSALYIYGPIVDHITPDFNCDSPYVFTFNADITDADYWDWDFDDGTTIDSSVINPITYTYSSTGTYEVSITAYNELTGCTFDTVTNPTFLVADIQAEMDIDTLVCVGTATFDGSPSQDETHYYWEFGDTTNSGWLISPTTTHSYPVSGYYDITLIVHDGTMHHCEDTVYEQIYVTNIHADFVVDTLYGCAPFEVSFTDSSISDFPYIAGYDFGDGTPFVNATDTSHIYSNPGFYTVSFAIIDTNGCNDDVIMTNLIAVYGVDADFYISDSTLCTGQLVQFNADTNDVYNYYWDYGNGTTSTDSTIFDPEIFYSDTGFYSPQLIVEYDTLGCRDTIAYNSLVHVQGVTVNISLSPDTFPCFVSALIDTSVLTNNTSTNYGPMEWYWTFGNGSSSILQNPTFNYSQPGSYYISLEATTTYGCVDKDSLWIRLDGPWGVLQLDNDSFCVNEDIVFSLINTMDIDSVYWDFGDGNDTTFNLVNFIHSYNTVGNKTIRVYLFGGGGCNYEFEETITIIDVYSNFNVYDTSGTLSLSNCAPFILDFVPDTTDADLWEWDFGDGQSHTGYTPPSHTFYNTDTVDIVYLVQLTVSDLTFGCLNISSQNVTVYADPQITISEDKFICRGEEVSLYVTGGNTVYWTPDTSVVDPYAHNTFITPDSTITLYAEITDFAPKLCTNNDSITITVQQEPNVYYSPDTTIVIGEIIDLYISADQANVSFLWQIESNTICANCTDYIDMPLLSTEYTIIYEDSAGCFSPYVDIMVTVEEKYSVDLPMAFTPNGDGVNDVVYVRGWGIKQLLEFNIYNRWGQKIFFTDDIKQGWDGTYKGKKQNLDTYAYYVKVLRYSNRIVEKSGTINLMR